METLLQTAIVAVVGIIALGLLLYVASVVAILTLFFGLAGALVGGIIGLMFQWNVWDTASIGAVFGIVGGISINLLMSGDGTDITGPTAGCVSISGGIIGVFLGSSYAGFGPYFGACIGALIGGFVGVFLARVLEPHSHSGLPSNSAFHPIYRYDELPKLERPAGYVYAIKDKRRTGLVKIGMTGNPKERMQQLRRSYGKDLEFVSIKQVKNVSEEESRLHKRLASRRQDGEWFNISELEGRNLL